MQAIFVRILAVSALLFCISGVIGCSCSSRARPKAVYGKVTSVRPVAAITFRPVEGTSAPAVTTEVKDGAYKFNGSNGPVPGNYVAVFQFTDIDVTFKGSGKNPKEVPPPPLPTIDPRTGRPIPVPPPPPPMPDPVVPVTVPAKGSLEIDIAVP